MSRLSGRSYPGRGAFVPGAVLGAVAMRSTACRITPRLISKRSFQGHECHRASPNSTRTAATAAQTNKFRCGGGGGVGVSVTRCPCE